MISKRTLDFFFFHLSQKIHILSRKCTFCQENAHFVKKMHILSRNCTFCQENGHFVRKCTFCQKMHIKSENAHFVKKMHILSRKCTFCQENAHSVKEMHILLRKCTFCQVYTWVEFKLNRIIFFKLNLDYYCSTKAIYHNKEF